MEIFKQSIKKAIELCNIEIKKRNQGVDGESSIKQLTQIILPELKHLEDLLEKNQLPDKEERFLNSFANAFMVWGWNMQKPTELFVILNQLNNQYKEV